MFMHEYTTDELQRVVWIFMARGYHQNANSCLAMLWAQDAITTNELQFWLYNKPNQPTR